MNVKWKSEKDITKQAGGLLITRRSGTLRRALSPGNNTIEEIYYPARDTIY